MLRSVEKKPVSYVGYPKDLTKRIKLHNFGKGAKFTRGRRWIIIYKEKLNTGVKDVDVGCGICCRGCKNIFAYICFNLNKCSNYIMNKCNDKMNNN